MNTNNVTRQAMVKPGSAIDSNKTVEKMDLFNPDGTPFTGRNLTYAPVVTDTAIGTAAKVTTSPEPAANTLVPIKFTNGNSAGSPTVAFNGGTARAIYLGGAAPAGAEATIAANGVGLFFFDGTVLHQIGVYS